MTTDHTTLAAWLPLLQHPEVGERICEAAGCYLVVEDHVTLWMDGMDSYYWGSDEMLPIALVAALAFGTLAVLADNDGEGWLCCYDEPDEWSVMDYEGLQRGYGPALPAAVLAAALRVWCE